MSKKIFFLGIIVCVIVLTNCNSGKKNNVTSDELMQQYIDSCASLIVRSTGVDYALAIEQCSCRLQALYSIDSTIFGRTNAEEVALLTNQYASYIDSICELSKFIEKFKK